MIKAKKVYLVGAGPGDLSLLTLKAVEVLKCVDIILHDHFIDKAILKYAKKATFIPVGKTSKEGNSTFQQERIIRLMIRYSYSGYKVCRLKGGDPFIFGRGGEELLALAKAKVPFEIVPGVSSFYSAPEVFGIPITHRGSAMNFGVFTAQTANQISSKNSINWSLASELDTCIFLMGVNKLPFILNKLLEYKKNPKTPIAIISQATRQNQKLYIGTLANILEKTIDLKPPATIVIGEVVNLRKKIYIDAYTEEEELESILHGIF